MIELKSMDQTYFNYFFEMTAFHYAKEFALEVGCSFQDASEYSKSKLNDLLPEGIETPDNDFYLITKELKKVGHLWMTNKKMFEINILYISEIFIDEEYRHQGIGKKTLELIDHLAKTKKAQRVALQVFGNNQVAYELYKKHGFRESTIAMKKDL